MKPQLFCSWYLFQRRLNSRQSQTSLIYAEQHFELLFKYKIVVNEQPTASATDWGINVPLKWHKCWVLVRAGSCCHWTTCTHCWEAETLHQRYGETLVSGKRNTDPRKKPQAALQGSFLTSALWMVFGALSPWCHRCIRTTDQQLGLLGSKVVTMMLSTHHQCCVMIYKQGQHHRSGTSFIDRTREVTEFSRTLWHTRTATVTVSISLSRHLDHHQSVSLTQLACIPTALQRSQAGYALASLSEKTTRMWRGNTERTAAIAKMKTRLSCQSWWLLSIGCSNNRPVS